MKTLEEIFEEGRDIGSIIADLKVKSVNVPDWGTIVKDYDSKKHDILSDAVGRKDKILDEGGIEKAARISIGFEELIANRLNQFTFSIPVKREYGNIDDNETRKKIARAIEQIYKNAHINAENLDRGLKYFVSCEIFSVWYTIERDNDLYGFPSKYKLRCKTYSPMEDEVKLYPLIDELGEMWAMSFRYTKKANDKTYEYFETYTNDRHYLWCKGSDEAWKTLVDGEKISIKKIPGIYLYRKKPCFSNTPTLRNEIEYTVSRSSDTIAYNSAPIVKVAGGIKGQEKKGESRRVWRVEKGGDVSYVEWSQSTEANANQVETMMKIMFMLEQMPDISFDNMKSLGNIGYDARKLMFADAHLRVNQESGAILEFLERENNVIKSFLKEMNKEWESEIDNVTITNVITPYIPDDLSSKISIVSNATGGKQVMSTREAIQFLGISPDTEQTIKAITEETEEEAKSAQSRINNLFE